jgi:hypothetical protein
MEGGTADTELETQGDTEEEEDEDEEEDVIEADDDDWYPKAGT